MMKSNLQDLTKKFLYHVKIDKHLPFNRQLLMEKYLWPALYKTTFTTFLPNILPNCQKLSCKKPSNGTKNLKILPHKKF